MYKLDFVFERTNNASQAQQVVVREMAVENVIRQHTVFKNRERCTEDKNGESLRGYKFTYEMKKGVGTIVYKRYSVQGKYVATIELSDFSKLTNTFSIIKSKLELIAHEAFEKLRELDEAKVIFSQEKI